VNDSAVQDTVNDSAVQDTVNDSAVQDTVNDSAVQDTVNDSLDVSDLSKAINTLRQVNVNDVGFYLRNSFKKWIK
jgi:type II secretory pathway component PulM